MSGERKKTLYGEALPLYVTAAEAFVLMEATRASKHATRLLVDRCEEYGESCKAIRRGLEAEEGLIARLEEIWENLCGEGGGDVGE